MSILKYWLYACCTAGLLTAADTAAASDSFDVTPITSASADSAIRKGPLAWGPAGALIPESEWKQYVGRPSAFTGSRVWAGDPARMPVLGGAKHASVTRRAPAKASTPPAPKPDPCAEKVRQALEEAAKTGKIPAPAGTSSAAPAGTSSGAPAGTSSGAPAGTQSGATAATNDKTPSATPAAPDRSGTPAPGTIRPETAPATTPGVSRRPDATNGNIPIDRASNVAAPGTSAQGTASPRFGGGVARAPAPFSLD